MPRLSIIARAATFAVVLAALPATSAVAQSTTKDRIALDQYLDWEDVQSPALSPDGTQIVYARRWVDKMNDKWQTTLWLMNADGSHARAIGAGGDAVWSPDGTRIAFVAPGEPSGPQIFVRWMDATGAISQISHLTAPPSALVWSRDGKSIAFAMNVPDHGEALRIAMPAAPKGAKWIEPPKIVSRLNYRSDRIGFTDDAWRHVFVIPSDGGTARQLTDGPYNDNAPSWSADGKTIAFASYRGADAESAFRKSHIYAVDVAGGAITQLTRHAGNNSSPVFSPDGKTIAFFGADSVNHSAWSQGKLWMMNADGSNARAVSELGLPLSDIVWAADGSGAYVTVQSDGAHNAWFAPVSGKMRPITSGEQLVNLSGVSRDGRAVAIRSTPTMPNDVVTFAVPKSGTTSAFTRLTAVDDDVLEGKTLGQTETIWYTSRDGLKIQGWIVKPPHFDPSRKYPLILQIHGGPQSMYDVGFNFARQELAAHDYVLLYTNPRGSTGYGEKFTNEIDNAYPGKDFDDLMAGVDTVIGRGYVDTKNMFVYGCSGGGVLTAWTVGHTDRFAAAASLCPVIDWISFVGETDGAGWYQNFEKPFWEDPSEYLRRSPIMYVGNVKTPTLLMTGVLDLRTPIPQIEEFYRALKVRGVPTLMVRMNNEYHGTSSTPSNFLRTQLYLASWFERYSSKAAQAGTPAGGSR